jgi:hypothetical protein
MSRTKKTLQPPHGTDIAANNEAVQHLKQAIIGGKHWYIALLEAIGLWRSAEETHDGHHYQYLIAEEAFDWLSLAERLCMEVDGLLPRDEEINLLFFAKPPIELSKEEFKNLIGDAKYIAYLNYLYGVTIEEALILATEEDIYKEHHTNGFYREDYAQQEAYYRVYGSDMSTLLHQFRIAKGYPLRRSLTLTEQKEFTYWLFKYRLNQWDKARVASDTKKALECLDHHWGSRIR